MNAENSIFRLIKKSPALCAGAIIVICGLVFTIGSLIAAVGISNEKFLPTVGRISSFGEAVGDDSPTVYVDYYADGVRYTHVELGSYSSSWKIGDEMKLKYKADDPTDVHKPIVEKLPYVFLIVGAVWLVLGAYLIANFYTRVRRDENGRIILDDDDDEDDDDEDEADEMNDDADE